MTVACEAPRLDARAVSVTWGFSPGAVDAGRVPAGRHLNLRLVSAALLLCRNASVKLCLCEWDRQMHCRALAWSSTDRAACDASDQGRSDNAGEVLGHHLALPADV